MKFTCTPSYMFFAYFTTNETAPMSELVVVDPGLFLREGGTNSQNGCANLFFAENCMKMKEFGPPGLTRPWCPFGSANG